MRKGILFYIGMSVVLFGCDLQPKIYALPDTIDEFINSRYPALLADPTTQPEIYNSAVTDYGVYNSVELYGQYTDEITYANVSDYKLPQSTGNSDDYIIVGKKTSNDFVVVNAGDTLYSIAKQNNTSVDELAKINSLSAPFTLSIGQKIALSKVPESKTDTKITKTENTPKQTMNEITVSAGDTLYSLSRKYSVPVNDIAVLNGLSAPFTLSVGQKLKIISQSQDLLISANTTQTTVENTNTSKKISSDPTKKLPKIQARSSTKFSWPVRGKIVSAYGGKDSGGFNDGINISAPVGTSVNAAENGVVAYAGNEVKGMGNLVIIQHSDGWMTVYAHLDSMNVKRGNKVSVGQKIGTVGKTG
ncbi:MAG: M23 family metallopeptidase, partial [Alphaproteobacteria bacterium]|nr:M23 family metallopeptidase [Alphaproteobacteria bacterium]